MKTAYFIPTNRDTTRSITSYARELAWAQEEGHEIPLLVVESKAAKYVSANRHALSTVASSSPDALVYHVTLESQRAYFEAIFADGLSRWNPYFCHSRKDYGLAMNKIFLMTTSLDCEGFHRRDSDTSLAVDNLTDVKEQFPIAVELAMLGKRVGQLAGLVAGDYLLDDERVVTVVGGNYVGEWNLDVRDLARENYDPILRLYEVLGFDPESVPEIVSEAFPSSVEYNDSDTFTLVASVNDGLNPDCGNVAVTRLHELFPAVMGNNILAGDYFAFDLATSMGFPSVHHTRSVFHAYSDSRFDRSEKITYWEGVARFADYFNAYGGLYDGSALARFNLTAAEGLSSLGARGAARAIRTFATRDEERRVDRVKRIAEDILIPFDDQYREIGEHLLTRAEKLVDESAKDYGTHADLLEAWQSIMVRAREVALTDFIKPVRG